MSELPPVGDDYIPVGDFAALSQAAKLLNLQMSNCEVADVTEIVSS
jgi:hypothetical protein